MPGRSVSSGSIPRSHATYPMAASSIASSAVALRMWSVSAISLGPALAGDDALFVVDVPVDQRAPDQLGLIFVETVIIGSSANFADNGFDTLWIKCLMRVGLQVGHPRDIAVPLGKECDQ